MADTYTNVKSTNRIIESACDVAESCATKAAQLSTPIVDYTLQNQLNKIDNYGCEKLDTLEQSYPVILKPSDEVMRQAQESVSNSTIVQRVTGYRQTIENGTHAGGDKVLDTVEGLVDHYLPNGDNDEQDDELAKEHKHLWEHTIRVIKKIRYRMAKRGQKAIDNSYGRSVEVMKGVSDNEIAKEIRKAYEDFHEKYVELQKKSENGQLEKKNSEDDKDKISEEESATLNLSPSNVTYLLNNFHQLEERTRQLIVSYATMGWNAALAASSVGYEHLSENNQILLAKINENIGNIAGKSPSSLGVVSLLHYILLSPIAWLPVVKNLVHQENENKLTDDNSGATSSNDLSVELDINSPVESVRIAEDVVSESSELNEQAPPPSSPTLPATFGDPKDPLLDEDSDAY